MTDTVQVAMIVSATTIITSVITLAGAAITKRIDKYHTAVNGKMDALLKVTGDSREAKGRLEGKQSQIDDEKERNNDK